MSIASNFPSSLPSLLLDFANVKRLDPRITFVRTTTATYYDGVTTAKAEENLVLYSQEFDNAWWTKGASAGTGTSTVTANAATAPDGTSTADRWVATRGTSSWVRIVSPTISAPVGSTVMLSIYAQRVGGTNQTFYLREGQSGGVSSALTATSAWQRFTLSATVAASGLAEFNVWQDTTDCDIYIWGAQLEQRSSATAYTATTTQAITNYIPVLQTASAGQARFDHNPTTGESLGLLIEEARTNSLTYSAQFDNAAWTKTNATITADTIVAPDGTLTGDKLVETTANGQHRAYQVFGSSGTAYTFTCYLKAGERNWAFLNFGDITNRQTWFNLATGVIGTVGSGITASMVSVGNGWYRCSVSKTASANSPNFDIGVDIADNNLTYTGNGFSGIFIWGAQLEAGSFATSYIPTVASSVTRNADAASMTGTNFSSWFNNGEGTVYFEAQPMYVGTASASLNSWLWDGTTNNLIAVGQNSGSGQALYVDALVRINGSDVAYGGTTTGVTTASAFKSIAAYEFNNTGAYLNGASFLTDTSCTIPVVNQWKFSGNYGAGNTSNGWVRKLSYYPQRLSATNLAALTT